MAHRLRGELVKDELTPGSLRISNSLTRILILRIALQIFAVIYQFCLTWNVCAESHSKFTMTTSTTSMNTSAIASRVASGLALTLALLLPTFSQAQTYTVDTSATSPLTGLWWNANESGWGATLTQQSSILFVTMFVYDATGNPTWTTVSCTISGATCSGDMLRFRGGAIPAMPWNGNALTFSKVGTMTLTFTSNDAGAMSYSIDGLGSTRQITRQIFGPLAPVIPGLAGQWQGAIVETRSNCTQSQINGGRATYGQYDIGMVGATSGPISIMLSGVTGLQCTYTGSFSTNGARLMASGGLNCSDGKRGTWRSTNIFINAKSMTLELSVQLDTTETCTIAAILGGLRP